MVRPFKDYTGQRFTRFTVISYVRSIPGNQMWLCRCDCGEERVVAIGNLKAGKTKSCGCLRRETVHTFHFKHGMSKHPIYTAWAGAKDRCYNKNDQDYKYYGGRGIKVSPAWLNFWTFWEDVAAKWRPGMTLDRIDTNGWYEKENCRWLSLEDQQRNRRPRQSRT